jgi:AcrR family transcriptional regulator
MAEIAARADAKIGSLYRFFPNKDAVAEALMSQYSEVLRTEYDAIHAIHAHAAAATPQELADILIDLLVGMTMKDAPTTPGAPDQLRLMNRLYLAAVLRPGRTDRAIADKLKGRPASCKEFLTVAVFR